MFTSNLIVRNFFLFLMLVILLVNATPKMDISKTYIKNIDAIIVSFRLIKLFLKIEKFQIPSIEDYEDFQRRDRRNVDQNQEIKRWCRHGARGGRG